jgi:hypothetical protein
MRESSAAGALPDAQATPRVSPDQAAPAEASPRSRESLRNRDRSER